MEKNVTLQYPGSPWTPGLIDRLRTLVARMVARPGTTTCRDIAEELHVTKNAVVGKLKRLRAAGNDIPYLKGVAYIGRPQNGGRPRSPRPRLKLPPSALRPMSEAPKVQEPPSPLPTSGRLTLLELERHHCRWPYGDAAPYLFCGDPVAPGLPYCPLHARIACGGYRRQP